MLLSLTIATALAAPPADAPHHEDSAGAPFLERLGEHEGPPGKEKEEGEEGRPGAEWLSRRRFPHGLPDSSTQQAAREAWRALPTVSPMDGGTWQRIGPAPLSMTGTLSPMPNAGPITGRASAIAFDPSDDDVVYAGFGLGGLWRSEDGGASWVEIARDVGVQAIGAVLVDPDDPDTIYLGTGEDALWMGVGGDGLFISHDRGTTWERSGEADWSGKAISRIAIDPQSGDIYVGVTFSVGGWDGFCESTWGEPGRGLWRSQDGGSTFDLVYDGDVTDLEIEARTTPSTLWVGDYDLGLVRSIDGGSHFGRPDGLPQTPWNLHVALSADPQVVYTAGGKNGDTGSAWISTDGGASFSEIPDVPNYCYGQCYYSNAVVADPVDPGTVYFGGGLCAVGRISGATTADPQYDDIGCARDWWRAPVHPDTHDLVFDAAGRLWAAVDGGLAYTADQETWSHPNDGIDTIQLYDICIDPNDPIATYGGSQDNGPIGRFTDGWHGLTTGDGAFCAVDSGDPRNVLISTQYASVYRTDSAFADADLRFVFYSGCEGGYENCDPSGFISPIASDPATGGRFYVGTNRLWRSDDAGLTFEAISDDLTAGEGEHVCTDGDEFGSDDVITAIAAYGDTIYTGSTEGWVAASHDDGSTWSIASESAGIPGRWVTAIAIDPFTPDHLWIGLSGVENDTPGRGGNLFESVDGGLAFERVELPTELVVNAIAVHPDSPGVLFVGTDDGVLVTGDSGATWARLDGDPFPDVPVFGVDVRTVTNSLVVGTFGRSALEIPLGDGEIVVDPPAIDVEGRKREVVTAVIHVSNADPIGATMPFTAGADADWLTVDPGEGRAAGAGGTAVLVHIATDERYERDAVVTITADDGTAIDVPVHVRIKGRGCGCESSPTAGAGWLALLAALVSSRRASWSRCRASATRNRPPTHSRAQS